MNVEQRKTIIIEGTGIVFVYKGGATVLRVGGQNSRVFARNFFYKLRKALEMLRKDCEKLFINVIFEKNAAKKR